MEAEGGDGKEREVLIYQLRLGPTSVHFGNGDRNGLSWPAFLWIIYCIAQEASRKWTMVCRLWTHQQKWQYTSQMLRMKASQSILSITKFIFFT